MSSVGLVRKPVVHNLNLAVILAFISWVEPTLLVVATATYPFPRQAGEGWDCGGFWSLGQIKFVQSAEPPSPQPSPARRERGRLQVKKRSSENFGIWVLGKPVHVRFQTTADSHLKCNFP